MGLERVAAVLQGKLSNYDTDLLEPIVKRAGELLHSQSGTALRINADHARSTAFLIHDGVVPSNEGRGYVLRKIMRRALRNGRLAGANEPYFYKLTGFVAELMKPAYPELEESMSRVARLFSKRKSATRPRFRWPRRFFQDEASWRSMVCCPALQRSSCTTGTV